MYKGASDSKEIKNRMSLWFISAVLIIDVTWLITLGERRAKSTVGVWNFNLRSSQAQFFSLFLSLLQTNDGLEILFLFAPLQISSQKKTIL
jgi:hypothetical protein